MMYIYILLYVFIAPFAQSLEVQHQLTDNEIEEVFQTSRDKAPYHEVISDDHIRYKRSINQLTIRANFGGSNIREINLQPVEGFLAGKDTKIWLGRNIASNGTKFNYTLLRGIMENVNITFYYCNLTQSAISYTTNKDGMPELNGIIDSDKVIGPLKSVIRKRREVSSKQDNESNKNNFENRHIIYKRETNISDGTQRHPDWVKSRFAVEKISSLGVPDIVYPEILVYVDKTFLESFNWDLQKIVGYILTFWNEVDLYFRQLENPKVRLNIAGIVLCQDKIIRMTPFAIRPPRGLGYFSKFMFMEDKFELRKDYDIAVLMGVNKKPDSDVGQAHIRKACSNSSSKVESTLILVDNTEFSSTFPAVHELGHLFGAVHEPHRLKIYYRNSPMSECVQQTIMFYSTTAYKPLFFSMCSKKIMSFFFSREKADCLRNNPAFNRTDEQMLRILPGAYISTDEQCQKRGYLRALNETENPHFCAELRCLKTEGIDNNALSYYRIAKVLDGTPCGFQKFCITERCVKVSFDKNAENSGSEKIFVPFWTMPGVNKSSLAQCNSIRPHFFATSSLNHCELQCSDELIITEKLQNQIFSAEDGTPCGANRYCLQGKCVDVLSGTIVNATEDVQSLQYDSSTDIPETTTLFQNDNRV